MIDLLLYSQKPAEQKATTWMVPLPEELEKEIIATIKEKYGEKADFYIERLKVTVFE